MIKLFKNSHIIYVKNENTFINLVEHDHEIFMGKIIISDFAELNKICYRKGIIHILNTNSHHIPNEKIDCILHGYLRNTELESNIKKISIDTPIVYFDNSKKQQYVWCSSCNKINILDNIQTISKYCSEKCVKKDSGFSEISVIDKIIASEKEKEKIIDKISDKNEDMLVLEFDRSLSDKRTISTDKKIADKFQRSVEKDARRLEFQQKRESYKKEMGQPGLRKTNLCEKKECKKTLSDTSKLCKGNTKKGKQCTNRALDNSDYCGIISHRTEMPTISENETEVDIVPIECQKLKKSLVSS